MKWLLTVLAVAFLGVGVWIVTWDGNTPPLSYRVLTVELGDPEKVVVTFEVEKDPAATAECQVTAVGAKRDIVNRLSGIRIPPADRRTTVHKVTVPTDQPATSASVATCVLTGTP
ncbi:MAG TPA: DUF4307 domain-containing protein [Frankiaceae bacterium]|nr:DUF4307 domain-containing protein [Frankiaceae bacterium]